MPGLIGSFVCFQRIQNHMNGKERKDNRNLPLRDSIIKAKLDGSGHEGDTMSSDTTLASPMSPLPPNIISSVTGKLRWEEDGEPVFDVTDWCVERGALTFIVGPVGCGKSTLIKTLLGELSGLEGNVQTNFNGVAYCDQNPWIPNETVRNIITGFSEVDESWYNVVTQACSLTRDFKNWELGDQTVTGSSGITLSGGQKQRVVSDFLTTNMLICVLIRFSLSHEPFTPRGSF